MIRKKLFITISICLLTWPLVLKPMALLHGIRATKNLGQLARLISSALVGRQLITTNTSIANDRVAQTTIETSPPISTQPTTESCSAEQEIFVPISPEATDNSAISGHQHTPVSQSATVQENQLVHEQPQTLPTTTQLPPYAKPSPNRIGNPTLPTQIPAPIPTKHPGRAGIRTKQVSHDSFSRNPHDTQQSIERAYIYQLSFKEIAYLFDKYSDEEVFSNVHLYSIPTFISYIRSRGGYDDFIITFHQIMHNDHDFRKQFRDVPGFPYSFSTGFKGRTHHSGFLDFIDREAQRIVTKNKSRDLLLEKLAQKEEEAPQQAKPEENKENNDSDLQDDTPSKSSDDDSYSSDHDDNSSLSESDSELNKEIIKEYKKDAFDKEHIFSKKHEKDGIMKLGKSQDAIISSIKKIVNKLDKKGLLREGNNQIHTFINGIDVVIRVFIKNGVLLSVNAFVKASSGWPSRILGNFIKK